MDLLFPRADFSYLLPELLSLWPVNGEWNQTNQTKALKLSLASRQRHVAVGGADDYICVNTEIGREQLKEVGERIAGLRSVPWKYQNFFEKGRPTMRSALKMRPGIMLPITINNVDTTMRVNTVRRLRGKTALKMDVTLDTKHLPIILERETRCTCLYCGTHASSDEVNCRACGAPLPPC
jgi:hypothetical protein